jgi:hypothetical protein
MTISACSNAAPSGGVVDLTSIALDRSCLDILFLVFLNVRESLVLVVDGQLYSGPDDRHPINDRPEQSSVNAITTHIIRTRQKIVYRYVSQLFYTSLLFSVVSSYEKDGLTEPHRSPTNSGPHTPTLYPVDPDQYPRSAISDARAVLSSLLRAPSPMSRSEFVFG